MTLLLMILLSAFLETGGKLNINSHSSFLNTRTRIANNNLKLMYPRQS